MYKNLQHNRYSAISINNDNLLKMNEAIKILLDLDWEILYYRDRKYVKKVKWILKKNKSKIMNLIFYKIINTNLENYENV